RCSFRILRHGFHGDPICHDAEQLVLSTRVGTHGSLRAAAAPNGGSRCGLGTARHPPGAWQLIDLLHRFLPHRPHDFQAPSPASTTLDLNMRQRVLCSC
ncbi:unnamed protein product, partial [Urochloa humidicola]